MSLVDQTADARAKARIHPRRGGGVCTDCPLVDQLPSNGSPALEAFEKTAMKLNTNRRRPSQFKLSTDPASVEATTGKLRQRSHKDSLQALHRPRVGGSSDWTATFFPPSTRPLSLIAQQSLLPLTQGQWRAIPALRGVVRCSSPVVASTDSRSVESVFADRFSRVPGFPRTSFRPLATAAPGLPHRGGSGERK